MGYQAPSRTEGALSTRTADLKNRITEKQETWSIRGRLPRLREVPSEGLLEEVKAALWTIPTATITETNQLIYNMETLGYKMSSHKEKYPPWRRLEAKIKVA